MYPSSSSYDIKTFEMVELALARQFSSQELAHIQRTVHRDGLMDEVVVDMAARFVRGEIEYKSAAHTTVHIDCLLPTKTIDYLRVWLVRIFPWLTAPIFQPQWTKTTHDVQTVHERYVYNVVTAHGAEERYTVLTSHPAEYMRSTHNEVC